MLEFENKHTVKVPKYLNRKTYTVVAMVFQIPYNLIFWQYN